MSEPNSKVLVEFHVARGETHLGPWNIEEIAERVARGELAITDFLYDDTRADWVSLMECDALREYLATKKPKAPPSIKKVSEPHLIPQPKSESVMEVAASQISEEAAIWYVQKGPERYGPLTYLGLVRALQEKTVYDFDFACKEGMPTWVRIAELPEFGADQIRELAGKWASAEDAGVFFRRQHARVQFDSEVIVHDDRNVWMGRSYEASLGGSGMEIESATLNPGQVVRVHFAPCNGLPAFNALSEIVGKRYSREVKGAKSPVKYSVRFLQVDGVVEPMVREYFQANGKGN